MCLINTKRYVGKEGSQNEGVAMVKLIFESEKGQFYAGSGPAVKLLPDVSSMEQVESYDHARARDILLDINVWDGKKSERAIICSE